MYAAAKTERASATIVAQEDGEVVEGTSLVACVSFQHTLFLRSGGLSSNGNDLKMALEAVLGKKKELVHVDMASILEKEGLLSAFTNEVWPPSNAVCSRLGVSVVVRVRVLGSRAGDKDQSLEKGWRNTTVRLL